MRFHILLQLLVSFVMSFVIGYICLLVGEVALPEDFALKNIALEPVFEIDLTAGYYYYYYLIHFIIRYCL